MSKSRRISIFRSAAAAAGTVAIMAATALHQPAAAATSSLSQLGSQLHQVHAHQQSLAAGVAALGQEISALDGQISLVRSRESAVRAELAYDQAALARVQAALARERRRLQILRHRLARAKLILSRQLVAGYESSRPDLVSVVLNAKGFNILLEQIAFLGRAQHQQQAIISITRDFKARADAAAHRLAGLQSTDRRVAQDAYVHQQALAGMNALLSSRQAAVQAAQGAQQAALQASQVRAGRLRSEINIVRAQQVAAQRAVAQRAAAAAVAAAAAQAAPIVPSPQARAPALPGPSGWAIPYAIVLCESGGQNLPPNRAGASGYYQIIPASWRLFGGGGPAADLAGKTEQDAVAARIWNGGAGAGNWVCAGIVGIH